MANNIQTAILMLNFNKPEKITILFRNIDDKGIPIAAKIKKEKIIDARRIEYKTPQLLFSPI